MLKNLGKFITIHPLSAIAIILIITVASIGSIAINGLNQEFNEDTFLPDLPEATANEQISNNFSSTYDIIILIKAKNGDLITKESLIELLLLEKTIANSSCQQKLYTPEIPSISIISYADIILQALLQKQTATYDEKLANVTNMNTSQIKYILSNEPFKSTIQPIIKQMLTKDFDTVNNTALGTILSIKLNQSVGEQAAISLEVERTLEEIITNQNLESIEAFVMGEQIVTDEIVKANNESMAILLPAAFGLVIVILALVYRDILDMLFSLAALIFAIVWMYGFGAAMNFTFNPITTAIPVLIVGLGIDYGIHLTMRFREEKKEEEISKAVIRTVESVGAALLLATVTTVVAFLSNLVSPINLLGEFGILAAVGISASFISMILFIPSYKIIREKRRKHNKLYHEKRNIFGSAMALVSKILIKHSYTVIAVTVIITLFMGYNAAMLNTEFDFEDFLPENLEITDNFKFLLNEFEIAGGTAQEVYILITGDITKPDLLRSMASTIENMSNDEYIIKSGNVADVESILSLMQDVATEEYNDSIMYDSQFKNIYNTYFENGVPKQNTSQQNIQQLYDLLYEKFPDYSKRVLNKNAHYKETVLRIPVTAFENDEIEILQSQLKEDQQPLKNYSTILTGSPILTKMSMDILEESQTRSLIITLISSLLILLVIFYIKEKSLLLGFLTLLPVALCVVWTLGTMYLVGIPLNVMTITIASLTVGLGVTYGIHMSHRFVEEIRNKEGKDACIATVKNTGSALFGAAATTIAGFGLLIFALMPPLQQFGAITALTILYSFISSTLILPAVLFIWSKHKPKK